MEMRAKLLTLSPPAFLSICPALPPTTCSPSEFCNRAFAFPSSNVPHNGYWAHSCAIARLEIHSFFGRRHEIRLRNFKRDMVFTMGSINGGDTITMRFTEHKHIYMYFIYSN